MRFYFIIIFVVALFSCRQYTKPLVTEELKYSAYNWYYSNKSGNFEFYLSHYLNIDKNGKFILMRHDSFMGQPQYFMGKISDRLHKQIDSVFASQTYSKSYNDSLNSTTVYDGSFYLIDYKMDSDRKVIQFIPKFSPVSIQQLSSSLDTLIYSGVMKESDPFNTDEYKRKIKKLMEKEGFKIPKAVPENIEIKKLNN